MVRGGGGRGRCCVGGAVGTMIVRMRFSLEDCQSKLSMRR